MSEEGLQLWDAPLCVVPFTSQCPLLQGKEELEPRPPDTPVAGCRSLPWTLTMTLTLTFTYDPPRSLSQIYKMGQTTLAWKLSEGHSKSRWQGLRTRKWKHRTQVASPSCSGTCPSRPHVQHLRLHQGRGPSPARPGPHPILLLLWKRDEVRPQPADGLRPKFTEDMILSVLS